MNQFHLVQDWSLDDELSSSPQERLGFSENSVTPDTQGYREVRDDEGDAGVGRFTGEDDFNLSDIEDGSLCEDETESRSSGNGELEVNPFDGLPYSTMYFELLDKRRTLPVWRAKDDFVTAVEESPIVLVTGKAGSGKSTQVPQWCAHFARESDFQFGTVVCTQPSVIAAVSLATQIAQEMDFTSVGNEVGYSVPQMNCTNQDTILKLCTDETLLKEMAEDPLLHKYGFVVIDEVQERTAATDILLALLKMIVSTRDDLKVIVISLSGEMPRLEEFFEEVPIVDLYFLEDSFPKMQDEDELDDGGATISEEEAEKIRRKMAESHRLQKLDISYEPVESENVVTKAVSLVAKLHADQDIKGDFLVFLPSKEDIEKACDEIVRRVAISSIRGEAGAVKVIQLHQRVSFGSQQAVYDVVQQTEEHKLVNRRVIIADDLAESSFSLENIDVVIDSGLTNHVTYNSRIRMHSSIRQFASRNKIMARTERCSSYGKVYRLYSKEQLDSMNETCFSWITRSELSSKVLLIKRLLPRLEITFAQLQLIEPPEPESYMLALEELDYHGALDDNGNLADLGVVLSEFPLTVSQAKSVIASCGEDCTQEVLTIIAMLTSPSCFVIPNKYKVEATNCHRRLNHPAGEHFTLLNVYQRFVRNRMSEGWCSKNYVDYNALMLAKRKRDDLLKIMENLELPLSEPIQDPDQLENSVKKALLAGYFMQIAWNTDGCGNYHIIRDRHVARIHPNSHSNRQPEWVLFNDFELEENSYISTVSGITAKWVVEIVPRSYLLNLPSSESKDIILKTVESLQKYNAERPPPEAQFVSDRGFSTSRNSPHNQQRRLAANNGKGVSRAGSSADDVDDTDVITQTMRDVSYAYNRASEYLTSEAPDSSESQCSLQ